MTIIDEQNRRRSRIILLVDDARENLLILKAIIEGAGYTFMGARSGGECLGYVQRAVPRLILLDVEMPEMDGYETCRRLRGSQSLRQTPIVFLTARNDAGSVRQGLEAGGNDFMTKPIKKNALLERVDYWSTRVIPKKP